LVVGRELPGPPTLHVGPPDGTDPGAVLDHVLPAGVTVRGPARRAQGRALARWRLLPAPDDRPADPLHLRVGDSLDPAAACPAPRRRATALPALGRRSIRLLREATWSN
ncbi:hypothetical protein CF641_37880, partial [Burkholderia pseudomallei]